MVIGLSGSVSEQVEALFGEMRRLVVATWREVALFVGVLTALATTSDVIGAGSQTGINVAGMVSGYYLTRSMTLKGGLVPHGVKRSIWPYIGLSVICELAIAFGFVLLIVPGIVLGIRWLPAYGFLLAGGDGVTQSLGSSWEATRSQFWPLLVAAVIPFAVTLGSAALLVMAGEGELPVSLAGNLALYCGTVLWTALGLATYSLLADARREGELVEVFS